MMAAANYLMMRLRQWRAKNEIAQHQKNLFNCPKLLDHYSHTTAKINLIVRFDCPSQTGAELWRLEHYSDDCPRKIWERRPDETEKEFTDRATNELKPNSYGTALLIQKDLESHHANT